MVVRAPSSLFGRLSLLIATALPALAGTWNFAHAAPGDNQLASVSLFEPIAAGGSIGRVALSGYGRYVLFGSTASTLVSDDTNGQADVFLRDRVTGVTQRISVGIGGVEANGPSWPGSISADGRYVTFESSANNLVAGDDNADYEVFVRDRWTGRTQRAPIRMNSSSYSPYWSSISNDGQFVALEASRDVFIFNTSTRVLRWIAEGSEPVISGNGRYVVFGSWASNLVPDDTPDTLDLFVWDRFSRTIQRVTRRPYLGQTFFDTTSFGQSVSRDGRWIAFRTHNTETAGDANGLPDAFLWDRLTGETRLVSVTAAGLQADGPTNATSVSDDGRYVAFASRASNLASDGVRDDNDQDIFIKDMQSGTIERVSGEPGKLAMNVEPALSDDGRFVTFNSESALVPNDLNGTYDTYVHETGKSTAILDVYDFYLRPLAIDFGEVPLGTTTTKGFTLVNSGSTTLPITTIELLGPDRTEYVLKSYCGWSLEVGSRCWISVAFKPTSIGDKKANLHVIAGGIERHRALRGTGVH
jgi:Tol biopolymer transport system component